MIGYSKISRISKRTLVAIIAFAMIFTATFGMGYTAEDSHAKAIGRKNEQACDGCEKVRDGEAPSLKDYSSKAAGTHELDDRRAVDYDSNGYSTTAVTYEKLLNGAVYRGGNSSSGLQPPDNPTIFDNDPNDFASVLPYGDTYIDTSRIKWNDSSGFKIDIADGAPFKWIAGTKQDWMDSAGTPVTTDPLGDGIGLATDVAPVIAYVGPVKGYLGDSQSDWRKDSQNAPTPGQENIIKASEGSYLYRLTYPGAAVLKDGSRGNIVIEVSRVEIETTASQDNAVITLQTANDLYLGANLKNKNGEFINVQEYTALTGAQVAAATAGNTAWNASDNTDKKTLPATGAILDMDIRVTDSMGNPVKGSISYAAKDMDLDSCQDLWGRSVKGDDRYKFNEAFTILDGSLSYAVTPYYDHAAETERRKGWIPVAPGFPALNSPLHITKNGSGSHADGVRFSGVGTVVVRDKEGSFAGSLFTGNGDGDWANKIIDAYGNRPNNSDICDINYSLKSNGDPATANSYAKRLLYGRVKDGSDNNVPVNDITVKQIYDVLGAGSYGSRRGDNDTYETGFAVLMNAKGFKLQWSASQPNTGAALTHLFDDSIYTYIQQTHGVGGGIYFETYDLAANCNVERTEGTVTMGKGTNATVTAVPEDGHKVKSIMIGGRGLSSPDTYTLIYNDQGSVTGIKKGDKTYAVTDGKASIKETVDDKEVEVLAFEINQDGTVDVTIPNIQTPKHIHAEFTADYYFYKVWKDADTNKVDPSDLKLTATKHGYVFQNVEIEGKTYRFNQGTNKFEGDDVLSYENDVLTVGDTENHKVYYLVGNSFVEYGPEDLNTGIKPVVKTYPVKVEYIDNAGTITFTVKKADADNSEEPNITKSVEDGDVIWKIKYPAEGYTTKSGEEWPALGIEPSATAHNINHDKVRYYWSVKESVNGWELVEYNNSAIKAPGVIDGAKSRGETKEVSGGADLTWGTTATKDYDAAKDKMQKETGAAYMSVFKDGGKIVNEIKPPVGTPKETYGAKNTPQTADGKSMFEVKSPSKISDGTPNEIEKVELIDPETGKPASEVKVDGGTYTIDENGVITFTPDKDFVGDPPAVTVRGTDSNGLYAETTYTPHVIDNEETVKREIVYEYFDGTPVLGSDGKPLTVVQSVTFTGTVDPNTGAITWDKPSDKLDKVDSGTIDGYTYDRQNVPEVTVYPTDDDLFEKVIYSPKGVTAKPDETYGLPGEKQTGTPTFDMETKTMPDGTPNVVTPKLVDPKTGKEVDTVKIPGQGTYKLNKDGTITFTPEDGFVGNPDPVEVIGTDRNGKKAKTTYTPHIVDPVDSGTAKRTIHYTYLTEDGKQVTKDTVQTLTLARKAKKVDPKTGEVLEWGPWESGTFPGVKNPDKKAGKGWSTDDSAGELTVTQPGEVADEYIVYQKIQYKVTFLDGKHGKSDGKGDEKGKEYGSDPEGGNGVKPKKGYRFTGEYTYVIKDKNGKVIKRGKTTDPTSVEVIGDIWFTPLYEKLPVATYVDPATGRTIQKTLSFVDDDTEPDAPNDPKRKGYVFTGWKRIVKRDANGDIKEVIYEAQWKKAKGTSASKPGSPKTGDESSLIPWMSTFTCSVMMIMLAWTFRKKRY